MQKELGQYFLFVCRYEDKERLYTSLDKEIPNVYVTSSVPNLMEVGHIDAGKGKTLLWLLKKLEISTEEAMAFGDADNDISMLTSVKIWEWRWEMAQKTAEKQPLM